jgi:potassium uptake TrkH family protein
MQTFFEKYSGRFLAVIALMAFTIFIVQYGFYISDELNNILNIFNFLVFALFIFYQIGRIIYSEDTFEYIKTRWFDLLLLFLIITHTIFFFIFPKIFTQIARFFQVPDLNLFYIVVIQIYILISLVVKAVRLSHIIAEYKIQPAKIFLFSFLFIILFGTGLLMLPKATNQGFMPFIDALFTSTSAVCVTGLTVVDTATYFTRFGQIVVLGLIQIGGLGVMTLTTFFAIFFAGGLGIKEKVLIGDLVEEEKLGQIKFTLIQIILTTFVIEAIGAIAFLQSIKNLNLPFSEKVFHSVFHSVSAFCNAGFSTFTENLMYEGTRYNYLSVSTIGLLIVLGGLGFNTLSNLGEVLLIPFKRRKTKVRYLNSQTKIILITTFTLIILGAILTYVFEKDNSLKNLSFDQQILASIFQSITTRTAGFNTISINQLMIATSLVYILLMFIGASPGGTGGGIKTTTAFITFLAIYDFVRGKKKIEIFKRQIPDEIIHRAFIKIAFSLLFLFTTTILLTLTEPFNLLDILFEQFSAFGTVGLSRGITPYLSLSGKFVIIILMFVGRVGPITFLTSFSKETIPPKYDYPSEYISTV